MNKTQTLTAALKQYNKAEDLAKKFPTVFNQLGKDRVSIAPHQLLADLQQAGITEADLPAMEAALSMPGYAKIEKFISYWK